MKFHKSLLIIISLPFFVSACFTGNSEKKPGVFIPKDEMTDILTDIYLADGLLSVPVVRRDFSENDSTTNYAQAIDKYGYSFEVFNRNLDYYFTSEQKKMEEIYEEIIVRLSEMETSLEPKPETKDVSRLNLWNASKSYRMPDDGTANPVEFSIPLKGKGVYTIRARVNIFSDDQSVSPRASVWFWRDDGSEEGVKDMWEDHPYEKNGRTSTIELEKELNDTLFTHLKGRLIDFTPQAGHWEMHSSVSGITVSFKPVNIKKMNRQK